MKIILIQYNPYWEDKKNNRNKILKLLEKVNQSDILIFPEMTLTGFSMNSKKLAENREGESFLFFSDIAKRFSSDVFAGLIEKDKNNYFNTLLHIDSSGKLKNFYRKIHPFSFSKEDKHYAGGSKPVITKVDKWKIGLSVCYDLRFPELYRFYGKERVDLIINIANWPIPRIEHWRTLLKARAIENQCYIAGVNRVGVDPHASYNGFSSIFDPMGNEIVSVENKEEIFSAEIDINKVNEVRNKFPFLNDIKLI